MMGYNTQLTTQKTIESICKITLLVLLIMQLFCIDVVKADSWKLAIRQPPQSLDPAFTTTPSEALASDLLFDPLVRIDADGKVIPASAKSWSVSDDGKTYIFTLRDDLKWSDGKPVTAAEFKKTFQRLVWPPHTLIPRPNYLLNNIRNVSQIISGDAAYETLGVYADSEKQLRIELIGPANYFVPLLTYPGLVPTPSNIGQQEGSDETLKLRTSNGRYQLVKADEQRIELALNPHYYKQQASAPEVIELVTISRQEDALRAIMQNELDFVDQIHRKQASWISETFQSRTIELLDDATLYGVFNTRDERLAKREVRAALSLAIDRSFVAERMNMSPENVAHGFAPPSVWENYPGLMPEAITLDEPERRARSIALLDQVGYNE